jgi:hypothetical protein
MADEPRVIASAAGVRVRGSGNTLASVAREVGDPRLFRLEGDVAICAVAFTLEGELSLAPGQTLRMENPEREWARRLVYLLGKMEFRDCAIEGAYWIDVGPTASGTWRNVRLVSGENVGSGYPLLYFRSSKLDWQGGMLDACPTPAVYTPRAMGTRRGYHHGDATNTIRSVTIRSRGHALFDDGDAHTIDLTFEACDFVTQEPGDRAVIESQVTLADLGQSRFRLVRCRRLAAGQQIPFDAIVVGGSAATITLEPGDGGMPVVHRAEDLVTRSGTGSGRLLRDMERRLRAARGTLARLTEEPGNAGSLYEVRRKLDYLDRLRAALAAADAYHPRDADAVAEALGAVEETLANAPETLRAGSAFRPLPVPFPTPPGGTARAERLPSGRVRVTTGASAIEYDPNAEGKGYAAITHESRVRGRPLFSAYAPWGGPAPRYLAPTDSARMSWELPWQTKIVQAEGAIVGFTSEVRGPRYGARVSFIFFADLPDLILYHAESLQPPGTPLPFRARFAAFARDDVAAYNGMRFWNDDPAGFAAWGDAGAEQIHASDGTEGVFVTSQGNRWYRPSLTRGLIAAQRNGANDWKQNPPCGWIVRRRDCEAVYTNRSGPGGYYSHVVELHNPSRTDPEDLAHQLLWFEGTGLGCWENLFALEEAFNSPCRLAPLTLRQGVSRLAVELLETDGRARPVEIAVLPRAFGGLETERPIYRGDRTVLLLRDVPARGRVPLGTLPVRLGAGLTSPPDPLPGAGRGRIQPDSSSPLPAPGRGARGERSTRLHFTVESSLPGPLRDVTLHLPIQDAGAIRSVRHGEAPVTNWSLEGGELIYTATVAPGRTEITIDAGG